ncbi:MAG: MucB/RseB C-terminal domain-containing protein [Pseudomonadota bacterium]
MMSRIAAWIWLFLGLAQPVWAQAVPGQQEGLQWLQRVAVAAQKLSYSGTFVYRNGAQSETSRIVHVANNGVQSEKLEVLDGSPREVIRRNDEVRCYLPEKQLIIIEQRGSRRAFPALLPLSLAGLGNYYAIRKGGSARIAGFDSQTIRLEPRDGWRYGHQFWVEQQSGLLLKAELFDARGEMLESIAFTELRIGDPIDPDALKPSHVPASGSKEGWQVRQARLREIRDPAAWQFRAELPGFRRQAAMVRSIFDGKGENTREVLHWVFSDGLAALSVFISPLPPTEGGETGLHSLGAISVAKRVVDGHQVVVMGDVPPDSVRHFADGIGARGK